MLFLGTAYDNTFSIWKLSINSLFQLTSVYGGFASRSLSHNKGSNFLCSSLLALHSSLVLLKRKKKTCREKEASGWFAFSGLFLLHYQSDLMAIETDRLCISLTSAIRAREQVAFCDWLPSEVIDTLLS